MGPGGSSGLGGPGGSSGPGGQNDRISYICFK